MTRIISLIILTALFAGCAPSKPQSTIIMQAEVAGYMKGDNDTAGYNKWMNEGSVIRQVAFQTGCQASKTFPNCHLELAEFQY
jgi:hypothetical protein